MEISKPDWDKELLTVEAAAAATRKSLEALYGRQESESMTRILFEDAFSIRRLKSRLPFKWGDELAEMTRRLQVGEPLQYVLGVADFYGLKFVVDRRVLIPRPETEELVHWVLQTLRLHQDLRTGTLLDIGTGSGCIPIALKHKEAQLQVMGIDLFAKTLEIAHSNALLNNVHVLFEQKDILNEDLWPGFGQFDLIVSNPPYIPNREKELMPEHVLKYEPSTALFVPDEDPLLFYEAIARFARLHLSAEGFLFFELNEFNAPEVKRMLVEYGFGEVTLEEDMQGKPRMIRCRNV